MESTVTEATVSPSMNGRVRPPSVENEPRKRPSLPNASHQ